jgi:hypothetical protein
MPRPRVRKAKIDVAGNALSHNWVARIQQVQVLRSGTQCHASNYVEIIIHRCRHTNGKRPFHTRYVGNAAGAE